MLELRTDLSGQYNLQKVQFSETPQGNIPGNTVYQHIYFGVN